MTISKMCMKEAGINCIVPRTLYGYYHNKKNFSGFYTLYISLGWEVWHCRKRNCKNESAWWRCVRAWGERKVTGRWKTGTLWTCSNNLPNRTCLDINFLDTGFILCCSEEGGREILEEDEEEGRRQIRRSRRRRIRTRRRRRSKIGTPLHLVLIIYAKITLYQIRFSFLLFHFLFPVLCFLISLSSTPSPLSPLINILSDWIDYSFFFLLWFQ